MNVKWDDDIPNISGKMPNSWHPVTTNQISRLYHTMISSLISPPSCPIASQPPAAWPPVPPPWRPPRRAAAARTAGDPGPGAPVGHETYGFYGGKYWKPMDFVGENTKLMEFVGENKGKNGGLIRGWFLCPNVSHHPTRKGIFHLQQIFVLVM